MNLIETVPIQKGCRWFLKQGDTTWFNRGFKSKAEANAWIDARIAERGLSCRAGGWVELKDRTRFEIVGRHGDPL